MGLAGTTNDASDDVTAAGQRAGFKLTPRVGAETWKGYNGAGRG